MSKLFVALVMVVAMAVPSYAALAVDNLVAGAEYSYSKKEIENVNLLNISLGSLDAGLTSRTSNVRLWQFAATVGYEINEALTPYAIIGDGMLNFDQELIINVEDCSIPILLSEFRKAHGLLLGAGAKGELLKFDNGVTIVYDTRWITFNSESDESMQILPGYTDISLDNDTEISYGEFTIDTGVTKLFDLRKVTKNEDGTETIEKPLAVEGVAPYLGIRYSHVDMVARDSFSAFDGFVKAGTEIETQGGMISGVLGLNVKVNEDWSVGINGILGQEAGVAVKVGFSF